MFEHRFLLIIFLLTLFSYAIASEMYQNPEIIFDEDQSDFIFSVGNKEGKEVEGRDNNFEANNDKAGDDYVFDEGSNRIIKKLEENVLIAEEQEHENDASREAAPAEHDDFGEPANELLHRIIENNRKEIMPKRPMYVKLDLLLMKVKNTIEKEGIFESVIALFMRWHDQRMTWDPAQYNNITALTFHPSKLWMPDIALINSADNQYTITKDYRFLVRVSYDGCVKFVPTATARTWCGLRLITFPFDIQTCSFEFESWTLDTQHFKFNESSQAQVDGTFASPLWTLCQRNATVYDYTYNLGENVDTFSRVRFDVVVRRKSTFYIVSLIFPCATLSLTQLLVFTIPTKKTISDRIGFGTVNVLTLVVFQTIISRQLPKSSDAISALSDYIIILIVMAGVGIFQSVLIQGALRKRRPPPEWSICLLKYVPILWDPPTKDDYQLLKISKKTKNLTEKCKNTRELHFHSHECEGIIESPLPVIREGIAGLKFLRKNVRFEPKISDEGVKKKNNKARFHQKLPKCKCEVSVRKWEDVITRVDCLVFLVSTLLAIIAPIVLFLPIIMIDNELCPVALPSDLE